MGSFIVLSQSPAAEDRATLASLHSFKYRYDIITTSCYADSHAHDSEVALTLSEELLHDVLTPCPADLQRSCWVADIGRLYGNLCQETEISTHYHLAQIVSLQTTATATLHVHGNA